MDKYAKAYDVCAHHCANGVANATCDASIPGSNPTAHWVDFFLIWYKLLCRSERNGKLQNAIIA